MVAVSKYRIISTRARKTGGEEERNTQRNTRAHTQTQNRDVTADRALDFATNNDRRKVRHGKLDQVRQTHLLAIYERKIRTRRRYDRDERGGLTHREDPVTSARSGSPHPSRAECRSTTTYLFPLPLPLHLTFASRRDYPKSPERERESFRCRICRVGVDISIIVTPSSSSSSESA